MKRIFQAAFTTAVLLAFVSTPQSVTAALPASDSQGEPLPTLAPMIERTVPAVVNIFTRTRVPQRQHPLFSDPFFRHFFDVPEQPRERYTQSLGSGVIIDAENGYVVTNHHVIARAVEIAVNLQDGRTLQAELVGSDPDSDLAVLRVEQDGLTALPFADSDQLRVGDFVVAIGNPFGLGQTVTSGMVSALSRSGLGIEGYEDFIQTDASINPGNSGGALVNLRGELVGINTAILSQSGGNIGIGFAIPINMAREITEQLVEYGEVRRGHLGAQAQDLTPELAQAFGLENRPGAVVTRVAPDSPAAKAGLQAGDVLVAVNGRPVRSATDVRNAIGLLRIDQRVNLKVVRNGETRTLEAVIREPATAAVQAGKLHPRLAGASFGNLPEGSRLAGKVEGVLVTEVDRSKAAWKAGLRPGDVITQANRQSVTNLQELERAVKGSNSLLLNIVRGNGALYLLIR
ncbi:serine protease Do [Thiohalomonas denitrificans]|uniref:Serine protease Do n=2 Tax=Thiohalomonas denitrificans TaxID=415747 RepID=A0A1G5PS77_9GAMM|nr:DegQ family serine endoprotease [Thiohalomonas denitrificans]SCZ52323.1 serine protease Do [Thiohalomonas denitrificans]